MKKADFTIQRAVCPCSQDCMNPQHESWGLKFQNTGLVIDFDTKDEAKEWAKIGGYTVAPA